MVGFAGCRQMSAVFPRLFSRPVGCKKEARPLRHDCAEIVAQSLSIGGLVLNWLAMSVASGNALARIPFVPCPCDARSAFDADFLVLQFSAEQLAVQIDVS